MWQGWRDEGTLYRYWPTGSTCGPISWNRGFLLWSSEICLTSKTHKFMRTNSWTISPSHYFLLQNIGVGCPFVLRCTILRPQLAQSWRQRERHFRSSSPPCSDCKASAIGNNFALTSKIMFSNRILRFIYSREEDICSLMSCFMFSMREGYSFLFFLFLPLLGGFLSWYEYRSKWNSIKFS